MPYHRPDASYEERVAASLAALRVMMVALGVAVVVALAFGAWGFVRASDATSQVGHRLGESCAVQAKQLRAGRLLVAVIDDLHALLVVPLTDAEKRQQAQEPPAVHRVIRRLTAHSGAFVALVHTLPQNQPCKGGS